MLFSIELPILTDIINLFNYKKLLSYHEKDEIKLSIGTLIDSFIEINPLLFSSPNFEDILKQYVVDNIMISMSEIYDEKMIKIEIEDIYNSIFKYYFTNFYPLRSCNTSYIRKIPNKILIQEKINYIRNKPQPEQRTNEWYLFRHNLITASSAWKIFKTQSSINQLIVEKCKELDIAKYDVVNTSTPMHHGNKYEDVSIMLYEHMYDTKIEDFGCIQHDKYKFLGASPDGINIDSNSERYGRMLEIKNPTTREITGIPKEDYWIQMQLQMETCNLNECDFLETSFKEYENEEDFYNDGTFTYTNEDELKGIMIYFIKEGKPFYQYMPLFYTKEEYDKWYNDTINKFSDLTWIKNIYWKLETYSCILVLRNKLWFQYAIPLIENVWKTIENDKINGYEHRISKKSRTSRSNTIDETIPNKCLINTDDLQKDIIYIDTTI